MKDSIKLPEELTLELKNLRDELMDNVIKIGKLNVQKSFSEKNIEMVNKQLNNLYDQAALIHQKEQELQNRINSKYGTGIVDFETGFFTKKS